jgi:hypothetical protein
MPQDSQIIGVNSVTNIDLGKGLMPVPIVRNADWFEKFPLVRINDRFCCPTVGVRRRLKAHAIRIRSLFLIYTG